MKRAVWVLLIMMGWMSVTSCSGKFWAGTGSGVAGAGAGYELRARQQMEKIKDDLQDGRIDQKEYDIRKSQIQQMSLAY